MRGQQADRGIGSDQQGAGRYRGIDRSPPDQAVCAPYGALDLGTNNCRLLIAVPAEGGFRVVDSFSRIVRLGERVGQTGFLSDAAMARALKALQVCAHKIAERQVRAVRCVATGACRLADNAADFVDRVFRVTGIELEIISGAEEARLAVGGIAALFDFAHRYGLMFDIGGASTELIWARLTPSRAVEIIDATSLDCGVATLAERHGADRPNVFGGMVAEVAALLRRFERDNGIRAAMARNPVQLLGTSGTTTTLAGVHLGLTRYDRAKVDGIRLQRGEVERVMAQIRDMTQHSLAANGCIGPERADWVIPGAAILQAILNRWPCDTVTVADRGIRDGILRELMAFGPMPTPKPN